MSWTEEPATASPLAAIAAAVQELLAVPAAVLSETDAYDSVEAVYRVANQLDAAKLHLLRILEAKVSTPAAVVDHLTSDRIRLDRAQARRDVDAARLSDPEVDWDGRIGGVGGDRGVLQNTGALLATGDASRAHLDLAMRAVTSIPTQLRRGDLVMIVEDPDGTVREHRAPRARIIDGLIAANAARHAPRGLRQVTETLLDTLDPERSDRHVDPDAHARRGLRFTRRHGVTVMTVDLDDTSAILARQAITAFSAPEPAARVPDGNGGTVAVVDERTTAQREHDGLLRLIELAVSAAPRAIRETATVLTVVTAENGGEVTVDGHGTVGPTVGDYLTCDSRHRVISTGATTEEIVADEGGGGGVGEEHRFATRAQRAGLAARDRGCVAPGCTAPVWATHAHHVQHWQHGGPTSLDNLVLLCGRHHRALHSGHLEVRLREGRAESRRTSWATRWPGRSPAGPWVHNTLPADRREACELARHLRAGARRHPPLTDRRAA